MCFYSTPAQVSPLPAVLFRRFNVQQVPQNPPYLPASSLLFSYPCSLFLTGLRVSNLSWGVLATHHLIPNQGLFPPNPSCLFTLSVFSLHCSSFLTITVFFLFVILLFLWARASKKRTFLGDILPLKLRVRVILGLVLELGFFLG